MIRHQASPKERVSRIQQKRLALEARQRETQNKKGKNASTASSAARVVDKSKDERALIRKNRLEPEYKGTARPAGDPASPVYRGTARLTSRRAVGSGNTHSKSQNRHFRRPLRDEYLGTDEEDTDDGHGSDDYDDGFYSDKSTDMEAGIFDVEDEEQRALRMAKREDAAELKAEMAAKNAKLERKKKLAALAARSRR
jgi:hypothetical protein